MPGTATALAPADQRVADILGAVRRAFAEKGFDGASMQDLAREAGMSVGNFYRYFSSKAAIVDALIARDLDEMQADFAHIFVADDPRSALLARIREKLDEPDCAEDGRLWAEITAASLRRPELCATCQRMEDGVTQNLTRVFARIAGIDPAAARARFSAEAAFIMLLVKSAMMLPPEPAEPRAHLTAIILRNIDRTLDDIAAALPKV